MDKVKRTYRKLSDYWNNPRSEKHNTAKSLALKKKFFKNEILNKLFEKKEES